MMGVREIDRFLEQWQMDARDLHRRLILSPTSRERACRLDFRAVRWFPP